MKNSKQNKIPTFIEQFKISPKLCDDMVTYFNSNKTRHAVGEVGEHHVVKDIKILLIFVAHLKIIFIPYVIFI